MGHSFDMLTFDFLFKPPQPVYRAIFLQNTVEHVQGLCKLK